MAIDTREKRRNALRCPSFRRTLKPDGWISRTDRRAVLGFYSYPSDEPDLSLAMVSFESPTGRKRMKTLPPRDFILGEVKNIGGTVTDQNGADLSGATVTASVYTPDGGTVVNAAAMTKTGTTALGISYLLPTGAGGSVTVDGDSVAIYKVMSGSQIFLWRQHLRVSAQPG